MSNNLHKLKADLKKSANRRQAAILRKFFKTGPGEYGEGDFFLGIKVPVIREIAKEFSDLSLSEIKKLLSSKIHEERLAGIFVLTGQYRRVSFFRKKKIFGFYLKNTSGINNWDLVDLSAPNIIGDFLLDQPRRILYQLAESKNLWERRTAVISTLAFIRQNDFADTYRLAKILLKDDHDLMHKAVGWMLREAGKRDQKKLEIFLKKNLSRMPRTMLRYAIERLPEKKRLGYLKK